MTTTIEELWRELRGAGGEPLYRRVAADHPLELYAVVVPPDRRGLMLISPVDAPKPRALRTVSIERSWRTDGRWSLQVLLEQPDLEAEFAALCRDIARFTSAGISPEGAPAAVLRRIERWRALLEGGRGSMDALAQRGLAAELLVLEQEMLPALPPFEAVCAWTGPDGTPQDFTLPSGLRLEVKAARPSARTVRINGLDQLDPGPDVLELVRGAGATLSASLFEILGLPAKLGSGYQRDVQRIKAPLFRSIDLAMDSSAVMALVIDGLEFRPANIRLDPGLYATEKAYTLVREEGIPFRDAYRRVAAELQRGGKQAT